jgi:hypothetical protein
LRPQASGRPVASASVEEVGALERQIIDLLVEHAGLAHDARPAATIQQLRHRHQDIVGLAGMLEDRLRWRSGDSLYDYPSISACPYRGRECPQAVPHAGQLSKPVALSALAVVFRSG